MRVARVCADLKGDEEGEEGEGGGEGGGGETGEGAAGKAEMVAGEKGKAKTEMGLDSVAAWVAQG